jgi:uncharacterized membrane protein YfcA
MTTNIDIALWIPSLTAFVISFFTSMGGVSGAFLLLPFQVSFLGITAPSVSATNQVYNIFAIPSGVYRYWREGRMVWPLSWIVITGSLPGVFIGAVVRVKYLPDPRNFKLFAAGVLFYVGLQIVVDLLKRQRNTGSSVRSEEKFQKRIKGSGMKAKENRLFKERSISVTHFNFKRLGFTFYGESFDVSFWGIFALSFTVGIAGGIYGIGGGSIIAPFFITCFGLPVYTVAGAALLGTFVTSIAGVAFYQILAILYPGMSVGPDWILGLLFGAGGTAGMYMGARFQKYVSPRVIKWMLAGIIFFTAAGYLFELR